MPQQIKECIKKKHHNAVMKLSAKITKKGLQRYNSSKQKILIKEIVEGEDFNIGRFWGQAPEVY